MKPILIVRTEQIKQTDYIEYEPFQVPETFQFSQNEIH